VRHRRPGTGRLERAGNKCLSPPSQCCDPAARTSPTRSRQALRRRTANGPIILSAHVILVCPYHLVPCHLVSLVIWYPLSSGIPCHLVSPCPSQTTASHPTARQAPVCRVPSHYSPATARSRRRTAPHPARAGAAMASPTQPIPLRIPLQARPALAQSHSAAR
jgi:hypothetical protein